MKFYEKGDRPLEIVTSRQWYLRNGGRDAACASGCCGRGKRAAVAPDVHAGPLRELGGRAQRRLADQPAALLRGAVPALVPPRRARRAAVRRPAGAHRGAAADRPEQRGARGLHRGPARRARRVRRRPRRHGHVGDLFAHARRSPGSWEDDHDLFDRLFPYDLRPQAHEIIRTWLFATVVRAHHEHDVLPWTGTQISGWVLDPDRKKMSKSKGNVVTPLEHLERTAPTRCATGRQRPHGHGHDLRRQPDQGRPTAGDQAAQRLEVRPRHAGGGGGDVTEPIDRALLAAPARRGGEATAAFAAYDYSRASSAPRPSSGPSATTTSSWSRAARTARGRRPTRPAAPCGLSLDVLLRLFAPVLPFAAEEVWSWWREGSVHAPPWPTTRGPRPGRGPAGADGGRRGARSGAQGQERGEGDHEDARDAAGRHGSPRVAGTGVVGPGRRGQRRRGEQLVLGDGEPAVEVMLGDPPPKA